MPPRVTRPCFCTHAFRHEPHTDVDLAGRTPSERRWAPALSAQQVGLGRPPLQLWPVAIARCDLRVSSGTLAQTTNLDSQPAIESGRLDLRAETVAWPGHAHGLRGLRKVQRAPASLRTPLTSASMQILGNLLPGFRDLRGSLITGYLWLLFAWVVTRPDLSVRPQDRIFGSVYDLGHEVGRAGIVAAVSVAAFFVGAVSQGATERASRFLLDRFTSLPEDRIENARWRAWVAIVTQVAEARFRGNGRKAAEHHAESTLEDATRRARMAALNELNLPATLLVGDKRELFAEVDRLRAEGDVRLAAMSPLVALTVAVSVLQSPWWATAFLGIALLAVQGLGKVRDSRRLIESAIAQKLVPSTSQEAFEHWVGEFVANDLPRIIRGAADAEIPLEIIEAAWISTPGDSIDVTERVRELAEMTGEADFDVSAQVLRVPAGDGLPKTLSIVWALDNKRHQSTFAEGARAVLPHALSPERPEHGNDSAAREASGHVT